ncbi:MAG TPA: hypothetical protein DDZ89_13675 [Clostridiales bacterium]|nr:hypothetical protein [Clostridiales bacterium]
MPFGNYITANQVKEIIPAKNGAVTLSRADGETIENIKPRRLFPLTGKTKHINFLDAEGEEVLILDNMKNLDKQSKQTLSDALNRYYVIPKIRDILSIKEEYGVYTWSVNTDKGKTRFEVRQPSVDIKSLGGGYVVVKDINDNRYEIPDSKKLDPLSQRLLEEQL